MGSLIQLIWGKYTYLFASDHDADGHLVVRPACLSGPVVSTGDPPISPR